MCWWSRFYLRMLLAHMDRNQFEHILICSLDYSKDEYKNLVDEFVQIEMCNSLSLMSDVKAVGTMCNFINYYCSNVIYFHNGEAGGIGRIANIVASVLLMPSFYEGWGLPIIEDM